jgi:hypothetical protein
MSTAPNQLLLFEPAFSGDRDCHSAVTFQPKLTRPKLNDPRWVFTWQPPSDREFDRLMAEDGRATA